MKLTGEQVELLLLYLDNRGISANCPLCGHDHWRPGSFAALPSINEEMQIAPGQYAPMAQLICRKCAYVASFDALEVGLWPTEPPDLSGERPPA